jgi:hypothetical protein
MQGRVIRDLVVPVTTGTQHVSIPLDAAARAALAATGSALVSFTNIAPGTPETLTDGVQAFDIPLAQATVTLTQSSTSSVQGDPVTFSATVSGTNPFPGTPTGTVQFTADGSPLGSPVALDASGTATLTTSSLAVGTHHVSAVYSGDGDYAPATGNTVQHVVKGPAELLQDLSDLVASFNLPNGKDQKFQNMIANIEKQLAAGRTGPACLQLDAFVQMAQQSSGQSLTPAQSAQLVAAAQQIETLIGC